MAQLADFNRTKSGEAHIFNIAGTSDPAHPYYLNIHNLRRECDFHGYCSNSNCHKSVTVGAHVYLNDDNNWLSVALVGLCTKCNNYRNNNPMKLRKNTEYRLIMSE